MDEKTLSGHKAGTTDASGLRSANDMTDSIPMEGWGAVHQLPGVDADSNEKIRSAAGEQVDFSGKSAPGQPMSAQFGAPETEVPLTILINTGEEMGPTTGAGLRSAVEEPVKFGK